MKLADIWNKKTTCIIHTSTQEEADVLLKTTDSFVYNGTIWASWWDRHKEKTCYRINLGEVVAYGCIDDYIENGEEVIEFSDLFETSSAYNFTSTYLDLSVFNKEIPESVVPTLAEIKEKELTCCINVRSIVEAQFLDVFFECKSYLRKYCENAYEERMRLGYYRTLEDGVAFQLTDGVINDNCSANFYRSCGGRYGEVYEFSDLFPVGSTMVCDDRMYQRTESGITNYKLVPEYKEGGVVTLKPKDENASFASAPYLDLSLVLPTNSRELAEKINKELAEYCNAFPNGFRGGKKPEYADNIMATAESISHITGIPYENSINKLKTCLGTFSNDGISAKNGGKNSMKFTFYVTEGTRVDKSCNGTIPTMTTNIELLSGNVFDKVTTVKGSATCDKADYDERQGVLEALANAICGGNFYKAYAEAVKLNRCEDELSRTCIYRGKVLNTVEEK